MNMPKVGDKIYIGTSLYIGHGEDDVEGGLATISKVELSPHVPFGHYNSIFVRVKEVPSHSYNYNYLMEHQEEYAERFGDRVAYPDPDYNYYGGRW